MKTITITIPKSEIFFDVDAATHVFATASEAQAGPKRSDALEADSADAMRQSMLTRYTDRRAAELAERLATFMNATHPQGNETEKGVLGSSESYQFSLTVEDAFIKELMKPLANSMESYIAHGVIADWYTDAGDGHAASYLQILPSDLSLVMHYIVARKIPSRV